MFRNLTDAVNQEENRDYLTGTVNRRGLHEIWKALPQEEKVHCIYLDVDHFKLVNDVYGHARGDELLLFVSRLLQETFPGQLVVRMGGDEFVVLCDGKIAEEELESRLEPLQERLMTGFDEALREILSFSIGVVGSRRASEDLSVVLDQGDEAMYHVKKTGKGSYVNYETIRGHLDEQRVMKDRALTAFHEEEFVLRLQPVVYLQNSDIFAARAVLEWHFPGKGTIGEESFLPALEQCGAVTKLDRMLFEQVCRCKERWRGTVFEELQIYLRISGRYIMQNDGLQHIRDCLARYGVKPQDIKLCIEEEAFLGRGEKMAAAVGILSEMGFETAIENFGSASSFKVLQSVPSNILKLDPRLLDSEKGDDRRALLILRNVIGMGRDLQFMIVAQGIRNITQAGALATYGAQLGLGPFYGGALSPEAFYDAYHERYFFVSNRIPTVYSFAGHLFDQEGNHPGKIVGKDITFADGVVEGQSALLFPGGKVKENMLYLPKAVMYSESYTICMWINTTEIQAWASAVYITYANGFMSFIPSDGVGSCVFRMKDDREINEWFDIFGRQAVPGEWAYVCVSYDVITGLARLYFNGLLIGSRDKAPNLKVPQQVILGGDEYQKSYRGRIAGFEIYHCVLPTEEIERRFRDFQSSPTFQGTKGKK